MLREIGKRDRGAEERFLRKHARNDAADDAAVCDREISQPLRRKYLSMSHRRDATAPSVLS